MATIIPRMSPPARKELPWKGSLGRSKDQVPSSQLIPVKIPHILQTLLRRQGGRAREPGCKQVSTHSAGCFPPLIDMFYWAVEQWDRYFLQLGFQQRLCKRHLIKQRIPKQQTAKVIRLGQQLPTNTCSFWRCNCFKWQNKFQLFIRKKISLS